MNKILISTILFTVSLYASVGIIKESANVREFANVNSKKIAVLYKNHKVHIIKKIYTKNSGTWYKLDNGFISSELIGFTDLNYIKIEDIDKRYTVIPQILWIREYPLIGTKVLGQYKQNEIIKALSMYRDDNNDLWIKTKDGFISAKYLKTLEVVEVSHKNIEKTSAKYKIIASGLKIREYPFTDARNLGMYRKNEIIQALAIYTNKNNKIWIKTKDGFIYSEYLEKLK